MDDADAIAGERRPHPKPRARASIRRPEVDERVLLLVKHDEDVELARSAAGKAGVALRPCRDIGDLSSSIMIGAGAVLIADEMLETGMRELRPILDRQRKWSELPVIVLFREDAPRSVLDVVEALELHSRVKVVLLHRPVPAITLASALRSALKSRRRQYEVRDLLARLNKDVRLRDQFLAMLGHELRNPLNSIGYVAELFVMSGDALTPSQARWGTEVIGRQLRQLSRLLDQLLDVARVQRGKIKLEPAPVDLRTIARQCAEWFAARAKKRDFAMSLPERPVIVSGDSVRLVQVVENLLDNAYKYTTEGGRIRLEVESDGEAVLTVADNGRGIRRSAVAHVFEPFFQERPVRAGSVPGLGLGLAMVENLVRLHGGHVSAQSEGAGRGAVFEMRLPLVSGEAAGAVKASGGTRRLRLLIVEDDQDSADAFSFLLKSLGHEPQVVYDGRSAVAMTDAQAFDLAFIDIGLPDIDGEQVARRVRERLGRSAPTLVALTGQVQSGRPHVFDDYLLKPVGRDRVERLLASLA